MNKLKPFLIVATILVVVFCVFFFRNDNHEQGIQKVKIVDEVVKVYVVDTPGTRAQGLSGREGLAKDEGMLFIFENPGVYAFWMKDMNFPIDIIWFDEFGKVVYIKNNATPESYPENFVPPKEKTSKYVLEVFSGFSLMHNLQVGDAIEFLPK